MKFENTLTSNWQNAFRGLRHPMESYAKSDSYFGIVNFEYGCCEYDTAEAWLEQEVSNRKNNNLPEITFDEEQIILDHYADWLIENGIIKRADDDYIGEVAFIGPNDLALAQRMIAAGSPNDKFLRQIFVSVDITAPLFIWSELDTYKVGTVANSTSKMHKLATTPITLDRFETDDLSDENLPIGNYNCLKFMYNQIIDDCESLRQKYLETKDKRYWKELIRWLPESWLQTRTFTCNYSVLRNIIHWRQGHKLSEWEAFIDWCKTLPWSYELLFYHNAPGTNA